MRHSILALIIATFAFSVNAVDVTTAQEAVSHAERNYSTALGSYNDAAYHLGNSVVGSSEENHLRDAAAARAQAYTDLRSAEMTQQSESISHYGVKTNSAGTPVTMAANVKNDPTGTPVTMVTNVKNDPTGTPVTMVTDAKNDPTGTPVTMVTGVKNDPTGKKTINVAASTLAPATKVKTDAGIVTAGSLPKNTQVAVAFDSAFNRPSKHANAHSTEHNHGEHGAGNGANNAANSHSAHGLGGSESIGGGHSGGGFHY